MSILKSLTLFLIFISFIGCNSGEKKETIITFSSKAVKKILSVYGKIDKKTTISDDERDLLKRVLVEPMSISVHPNSIPDYSKVGKIISYTGNNDLMSTYIDFIIRTTGSDDDTRAIGVANLYVGHPEVVLNILAKKDAKGQDSAITSLAWGLLNVYEGKMNMESSKNVIVGDRKEIYLDKHPNKDLAFKILKKVRLRLK